MLLVLFHVFRLDFMHRSDCGAEGFCMRRTSIRSCPKDTGAHSCGRFWRLPASEPGLSRMTATGPKSPVNEASGFYPVDTRERATRINSVVPGKLDSVAHHLFQLKH